MEKLKSAEDFLSVVLKISKIVPRQVIPVRETGWWKLIKK